LTVITEENQNTLLMKTFSKHLLLAIALLFLAAPLSAQAELSREEVKTWKDRAKEYRRNLPALKNLVEERDAYESQVVTLQQEVNDLTAKLSMKDRQITSFEEQQALLNQRVLEAENAVAQPAIPATVAQPTSPTYTSSVPDVSGTVFRVQLGAFRANRVDADLATGNSIMLSETADGMQKVIVGEFRTYANARRLRDKMRQIGVKGAFVVASQDGQPLDVKKAVQYTGETID
jgi:hypothetical protein